MNREGVYPVADSLSPLYPEISGPPPMVYTPDHYREVDEALRLLAIANHILQKCERCNMPVEALRMECDAACAFFNSFNNEWRGQNAVITTPTHS